MAGTVSIARSLWDDEAFAKEPFSEREAWIWMICEASWKPRKRRVGDYVVETQRGQLASSIRFMAEAFGWHRNKVDRFIKRLAKLNMISVETGTGVSIVTICKYDDFQHGGQAGGTGPGQDRDRCGTNEKKGKREKGKNGGGGGAGAREDDPPPEDQRTDPPPTTREVLLGAMGVGPDGIVGPSRFVGTQGDMAEAQRWFDLPGITLDVACAEIRRLAKAKADGPPSSFKYFTPAIQRLSGQLSAEALTPTTAQARASPAASRQPSAAEMMAMLAARQGTDQ